MQIPGARKGCAARWPSLASPPLRAEAGVKPFAIRGAVAVVTGAGGGIGRALALDLAARGAALALTDRDPQTLAETAAACRAQGADVSEHAFDMADAHAIAALPEAIVARHGRADLLINNAGVALGGEFDQIGLDDFEWLMAINFWGPVRMCKAFMPHLRQRPAAHVVNISSLFGLIAPPGQTAYCAAKFGLRGFSESLRHELDETEIGVTVVHPGGVRTNIANNARIPAGLNSPDLALQMQKFNAFLTTDPKDAARQILDGVEKRAPRVLIGSDARRGDRLQRLMPGRYWKIMKKQAEKALQ
ncbi:MAG: SDR family NAD(P)-dependent oxidoreductase [Hyphomicrobiales bacterium]|nr:SDR family NAD(P)-dependent oxidoreductase [Hyphomicrobiales bacterium]